MQPPRLQDGRMRRDSCRFEQKLRHVKLPVLCCITTVIVRRAQRDNERTSESACVRDASKYFRVLQRTRREWEEEVSPVEATGEVRKHSPSSRCFVSLFPFIVEVLA